MFDAGGVLIKQILENYIEEGIKRESVIAALRALQDFNYAVVGGFAVSFYYKGARKVTPDDFDVKVLESDLDSLIRALRAQGFELKRKNLFMDALWYIFQKGGQGIDVGVAKKPWDVEGIKKAREVLFKGFRVKVMPSEYVAVSKLYAGRPKDMMDIAYMVRGGGLDTNKAKRLVKKFLPSELDDFEAIVEYADRFSEEELKKLFGLEEV